MPDKTLLIDGRWRAAEHSAQLPVINPANGVSFDYTAEASANDVRAAVLAAEQAFLKWSETSGRERANLMHHAMEIYRERYLESSAETLTRENGKPFNDSIKELRFSADVIDYYADESRRISGIHFSGDGGRTHSFVVKQPVGVVAAILPWNFPVDLLAWKLGPGLADGCAFVIKPSEEAPLAVLDFVRAFVDAGVPPGVINVVTGGRTVGAALVEDPGVQKIAFTGSLATGQWIAERAGRQMKHLTLELGGSAPLIVFDDADLSVAVPEALRRTFSHTGQICIGVNRIFVQQAAFDAFFDAFVDGASRLRVAADGLKDPAADMGPLINARGVATVQAHVDDALAQGAELVLGGARPTDARYHPDGFFYQPTVLRSVKPDMRVMQEETFGPVAPIMPFATLDEGIALANGTPYGLAAYVYTRDLNRAYCAARSLKAGGIGINVNDITDIRAPFGGMKQSGIGRELGEPGLDAYLETKHVRLRYGSTG